MFALHKPGITVSGPGNFRASEQEVCRRFFEIDHGVIPTLHFHVEGGKVVLVLRIPLIKLQGPQVMLFRVGIRFLHKVGLAETCLQRRIIIFDFGGQQKLLQGLARFIGPQVGNPKQEMRFCLFLFIFNRDATRHEQNSK